MVWKYGTLRSPNHEDALFLLGVLACLTQEQEANEVKPWKIKDTSPDYFNALLADIIGITIEITKFIGKNKRSQNKEQRDVSGAIRALPDKKAIR